MTLTPKKKEEAPGANELVVVADIHKQITAKLDVTIEADMKLLMKDRNVAELLRREAKRMIEMKAQGKKR